MYTEQTPQNLQKMLNGMGASMAVIELEQERNVLTQRYNELEQEIASLTFFRDQLRAELEATNAARYRSGLSGGMGLFKSAYRKQLERGNSGYQVDIAEMEKEVALLKQEISQLQFQLDTLAPNSEVLKATKQAMIGPGMNLNPKMLIAVAAVGVFGYLAYKKGWLKKLGV